MLQSKYIHVHALKAVYDRSFLQVSRKVIVDGIGIYSLSKASLVKENITNLLFTDKLNLFLSCNDIRQSENKLQQLIIGCVFIPPNTILF